MKATMQHCFIYFLFIFSLVYGKYKVNTYNFSILKCYLNSIILFHFIELRHCNLCFMSKRYSALSAQCLLITYFSYKHFYWTEFNVPFVNVPIKVGSVHTVYDNINKIQYKIMNKYNCKETFLTSIKLFNHPFSP